MILRSVRIENWRCIRSVTLGDLTPGITVLHGPNGTGKTSLLYALRVCLFDADHNIGGDRFKKHLPWRGAEPPKMAVEFTAQGADYRITKVFSTRKEGTALLERKVGGAWQIEQDAPKEASRRTRELLGAERSITGLNQLLWLAQGEAKLPDAKNLDGTIQQQLVTVLGVMVTGADLDFQKKLDENYARWFTPTGQATKNSPLAACEKLLQRAVERRDAEREIGRQWDQTVRELQACEDERPQRSHEADLARREVAALSAERERGRERLQKHRDAERDRQAAQLVLDQAANDLKRALAASQRNQADRDQRDAAQRAAGAAKVELDAQAHEHAEKLRRLELARQDEERHQHARDEIDDRRQLLGLAEKRAEIDRNLQMVGQIEGEMSELARRLGSLIAPDEPALENLRSNRREANRLRARLEAAALTVTVRLEQPAMLDLELDGDQQPPLALPAGTTHEATVRQRATLAIRGVTSVTIARAHENLDLETTARDLAEHDRSYHDTVRSFGEDPADETCLDRLAGRRLERDQWTKLGKEARTKLQQIAPDGRGPLEADRDKADNQRSSILNRRPTLASWQPNPVDVDELDARFKARATELVYQRQSCAVAELAARNIKEQREASFQELQLKLAHAAAAEKSSRDLLVAMGDQAVLQAKVDDAQRNLDTAARTLAAYQLTAAERTVDQRLNEAIAASDSRQQRLRELDDRLTRLRGVLQGNEGLHTRLADAEAAVLEGERAFARQRLEAGAHKHVRELFERSRENQVRSVMGPIADRVLDWSNRIGLDSYQAIRFGDHFLPEGLVHNQADAAAPIGMDSESYGTGEQLSLLVRLALGGVLARAEPVVAILDDPLAHSDPARHRHILDVLRIAAEGNPVWSPPAGPLQIMILTCHPERFDHLLGARQIDLGQLIQRI